jgi:hypothetical protein
MSYYCKQCNKELSDKDMVTCIRHEENVFLFCCDGCRSQWVTRFLKCRRETTQFHSLVGAAWSPDNQSCVQVEVS